MKPIRPIDTVIAIHSYSPSNLSSSNTTTSSFLSLNKGDSIYVLQKLNSGWWDGVIVDIHDKNNDNLDNIENNTTVKRGWFPSNFTISKKNYDNNNNNNNNIKILNLIELKKYLDNINFNNFKKLNWIPINLKDNLDKLIYYNKSLDIYCDELPLLNIDSQSNLSNTTSNDDSSTTNITTTLQTQNDLLLFYDHPNDIKNWLQLKNIVIHYLKLSNDSFINKNSINFKRFIDLTITYSTYTQLAYHLFISTSKTNFSSQNFKNKTINNNNHRNSTNNIIIDDDDDTTTMVDSTSLNNNTTHNTSHSHLISNNIKILLKQIMITLSRISINSNLFFSLLSNKLNTSDSITNNSNSNKQNIDSISNLIITDFNNFLKIIDMLHQLLKSIIPNYNTHLPQLFPRFLKNSFNGGCWNNPFHSSFNSTNININYNSPSSINRLFNHSSITSSTSSTSIHTDTTNNNTISTPSINNNNNNNNDNFNIPSNPTINPLRSRMVKSSRSSEHNSNNNNNTNLQNVTSAASLILSNSNSSDKLTDSTKLNSNNSNNTNNNNNNSLLLQTSSNTQTSTSQDGKSLMSYPLNNHTLQILKLRASQISDKVWGKHGDYINIIDQPKSRKRDLEINLKAYDEFNANVSVLQILENLNLSIFINLINLVKFYSKSNYQMLPGTNSNFNINSIIFNNNFNENNNNNDNRSSFSHSPQEEFIDATDFFHDTDFELESSDVSSNSNINTRRSSIVHLDEETLEFLRHSLNTVSSVITEFFDVKQLFHNTVIRLIICAQSSTLDDPFAFNSMKTNIDADFYEPSSIKDLFNNNEDFSQTAFQLYSSLVKKDVENNNMNFLNPSHELRKACDDYAEVSHIACNYAEQLVEAKQNLLDYAARMMKNELIQELLKGDNDTRWSENDEEQEVENLEYYPSISDEHHNFDWEEIEKSRTSMNHNLAYVDVPWHLRIDHDDDLIYDEKGNIKGGTREALVRHMINNKSSDLRFNEIFLTTFRSMFTTKKFLYALIYRYNTYPPEGLSYDEYNVWVSQYLEPIKHSVVNIMKIFFTRYWSPTYFDPCLNAILSFATLAKKDNINGAEELYKLVHYIVSSNQTTISSANDYTTNMSQQNSQRSNSSRKVEYDISKMNTTISSTLISARTSTGRVFDISPKSYAVALTMMQQDLYSKIGPHECLDRVWGSKLMNFGGSKNISNFVTSANNLTNFISYSIVKNMNVKRRARFIEYFIEVAHICKKMNNFSSMTAIVSSLYSSPIYRLKKTWNHVSEEYCTILRSLNSLMDSKRNFAVYRELIRSVHDVPCVPFFGVFLSDLTFTATGNSDNFKGSSTIVNFGKREKVFDILERIKKFKKIKYKLNASDDTKTFIKNSLENVPHIDKQYELSLQIEPRIDSSKLKSNAL